MKNVAHRWCDGRIPTCSMSGLVSTTLAFLRAHARSSESVSPSKVTARRPGTSHERNARSWSWASALVGKIKSAVSRRSAITDSTIGTW